MTSESSNDEREQLEQAIAALEAQRSILGNSVVDTAVAPLRQKLDALSAAGRSGERGPISERRIVTVLFCDMVGSTTLAEQLDPEVWTGIMNRVFRLLTEPVDRYGGTVTRLMGDAILALFGAPDSHEDDPERAILAGLSILEKTLPFRRQFFEESGMSFDFRVGINTGLAVVGEVGSEVRVEYTAMGDAVNVAARMEQTAAPGTVQISEATYQLVADRFEVEHLGPISVKGRERPVDAFQVLGRKAWMASRHARSQIQLVGRRAEMDRLRQIVAQVRGGQGQIALLLGEAGLGKTRLISELRAEWLVSQQQGQERTHWTELAATSYSTGRPYGTFENQMRLVAGIAPADKPSEARDKLGQVLAANPEHDFLQSIYERLLGIQGEDQMDLSSEAFKHALYESTLSTIRSESDGQPSVFVYDDLQWVDPASLDLIEHTLHLVSELPILVLFGIRPEPDAPAWGLRQRLPKAYGGRYTEIPLTPLTGQESVQLADAAIAMETVPDALRQLVLDRAEGNPFYIEELVQMLLDQGLLDTASENARLTGRSPGDAADVPVNLMSLVAARVDRLSRDARLTLQLAAVIGRSFYVRVLRQISETQVQLESHLHQLETAEMIHESSRGPEWEYIFRHALTHEAVYSTLLLERRRHFHRDVGQALEQLYPERLAEFAPILAHHFDEGQQWDKALHYYALAGNEAAMLHASEQAADYCRRALAIARDQQADAELIIDFYTLLGRALEHLHRFDEAIRSYIELEALGQQVGERTMVLASLTSRIVLHANPTSVFDPDKAEALAARALALAEEIGDLTAQVLIYTQLATQKAFGGEFDESARYSERALSQARALGDRKLLAQVLTDVSSHVYSVIGLFDRAAVALSEAIEIWRELGDRAMEADSLSTLTEAYIYSGRYDKAIALSEEAQAISRSIHNLWGESYSQYVVGLAYWERGRPDLAIDTMEESIRLSLAAGFMVPQLWTRCELAQIYADLGDSAKALALVEMIRERAGGLGLITNVYVAGLVAQVHISRGDVEAAATTFDSVEERLLARPLRLVYLTGYLARIGLDLRRGQLRQALSLAGELLDYLREIGARPYQMRVLLLQGQVLQTLRRPDEAVERLLEAKSLGESMGSRWMMWQIETELGRLVGDNAAAQEHFRRARELIYSIHDHTPEHLRDSFLGRDEVQAVLSTAGHRQS